MEDRVRDLSVEDKLARFAIRYHVEDAVAFDDIISDPNPARWEERYNELHKIEISCAILDHRPVPALLLYKPPGASKYRLIGGRHRVEAARDVKHIHWPAYVIDEPLDEFMLEALPIYDNVGKGRDYTKQQRLEFAAHLLIFRDRDPKAIANELQIKPSELTQFVDLQTAMNRAHDLNIPSNVTRTVQPNTLIEANKSLAFDLVFKAAVETLAFTELQGHAAKGLIKDTANARSEAIAIAKLADIYEKHKLELERQRRRGKKQRTPTLAQKLRKVVVGIDTVWPGRVEMLEITAHEDDFVESLEDICRKARDHLHEVIDRCAEVRAMREKYRAERKGLGQQPRDGAQL